MVFENGLFLPGVSLDRFGQPADPAAGANYDLISISGTGERYQLLGFTFTLETDANVANRRVTFQFVLDTVAIAFTEMIHMPAQVVQTAGTTVRYFVGPGYVDSTAILDSRVLIRMPWPLEGMAGPGASPTSGAGWQMSSDVENIQAGDQLADMVTWFRSSRGGPQP